MRNGTEKIGFLLSLPRSGSTLLSMMLDNHPEIASPPEPWILLALQQLGSVPVRHPANSQSVGSGFHKFANGDEMIAARAAADALYARTLTAAGKSLLIDKTPRYHLILDYLSALYPEARRVWLMRNPLDIAASYRDTWGIDLPSLLAKREDDPAAIDFVVGLDRLERFAAEHPENLLILRYEDLVADPTARLAETLAFFGADSAPEIVATLTSLNAASRPADAMGDEKIRKTSAPHARSIGSWEKTFNRDELQILSDALGHERLERLGYGDAATRLVELGVERRDLAADYRDDYESVVSVRLHDIARAAALREDFRVESPLVQERARFLTAGEEAWRGRYADRVELDRMQAFIAAERAEYAEQHGILHQEIAKRDLMVAERDAEIENRGRHIALVEEQRDQMRRDAERATATLTTARAAVDALQQALNEARAAIAARDARLAEMTNSLSWKATAPLRTLERLIH